jgi:anti-anti-sigma factor
MESTPRPITGYPSQRLVLPLSTLGKGLQRLLRPERLAVVMVATHAEQAIVEVHGALDVRGAERLKRAVALAFEEGAITVTIELSGATRVAPAGVAALVEASERAGPGAVQLSGLRPEFRWLLEKAGLHMVLEIME